MTALVALAAAMIGASVGYFTHALLAGNAAYAQQKAARDFAIHTDDALGLANVSVPFWPADEMARRRAARGVL